MMLTVSNTSSKPTTTEITLLNFYNQTQSTIEIIQQKYLAKKELNTSKIINHDLLLTRRDSEQLALKVIAEHILEITQQFITLKEEGTKSDNIGAFCFENATKNKHDHYVSITCVRFKAYAQSLHPGLRTPTLIEYYNYLNNERELNKRTRIIINAKNYGIIMDEKSIDMNDESIFKSIPQDSAIIQLKDLINNIKTLCLTDSSDINLAAEMFYKEGVTLKKYLKESNPKTATIKI